MKILMVTSETVPFAKTGGLADAVSALAINLRKQGHDVRVIIPEFNTIPQEYMLKLTHVCDFEVQLGWRRQYCGIELLEKVRDRANGDVGTLALMRPAFPFPQRPIVFE